MVLVGRRYTQVVKTVLQFAGSWFSYELHSQEEDVVRVQMSTTKASESMYASYNAEEETERGGSRKRVIPIISELLCSVCIFALTDFTS